MKNNLKFSIISILIIGIVSIIGINNVDALSKTKAKIKTFNYNSITISYTKVSNVSGYQIFRSTTKYGTYKLVKTTKSTSFKNTNLKTGKTYYYVVRSYKKSNDNYYYSDISNVVGVKVKPNRPTFIVKRSGNDIKITINKITGANGYAIYYSTTKNGVYTNYQTSKSNISNLYSLKDNKTYYFKVKSYRLVNGSKVFSNYSIIKSATIPSTITVVAPTISAKLIDSNSIKLSFNHVKNYDYYRLYRSNDKNGNYSLIDEIKTNSYVDENLRTDRTYYYKIKTVYNSKSSNYSNIVSCLTNDDIDTPSINVKSKSNYIYIDIDGFKNITGYQIYRSTSKNGSYKKIDTTKDDYYKDNDVENGEKYYYKVKAYKTIDGEKQYSDYSNIDYATAETKTAGSTYCKNGYCEDSNFTYFSTPYVNNYTTNYNYTLEFKIPSSLNYSKYDDVHIVKIEQMSVMNSIADLNIYLNNRDNWYKYKSNSYSYPYSAFKSDYLATKVKIYDYDILNDTKVKIYLSYNKYSSFKYYNQTMIAGTEFRVTWAYNR